ncbi:MAG: transporter substrate-binding domain-containing protein [Mangrovicoccus sp.]|nr:transporter substrate-binding domain-containing protein [Mangrovicoccus sp.]
MKTLVLGTALLAFLAGAAAAQDVVRLATEGAYPPYNFINDAGKVDGYDIAVGNEICKRAGLTCEWVVNDWDSIIPNLVSGNYDAILAGMSITDERDQVIDFTQNYLKPEPSAYAALEDGIDLTKVAVAAQTGTIQAGHVTETGATLVEFATPDETVAAVRNGEAEAVLADKSFLEPVVQGDPDMKFIGEDVFLGNGLGIGVRESDGALKDKFNAVLTEMKADGSLNALIDKWMPESQRF